MRLILDLARYSFGVWVSGILVTGCGGGGVLPNPTPALSSADLTSPVALRASRFRTK